MLNLLHCVLRKNNLKETITNIENHVMARNDKGQILKDPAIT